MLESGEEGEEEVEIELEMDCFDENDQNNNLDEDDYQNFLQDKLSNNHKSDGVLCFSGSGSLKAPQ